MRYRRARSPAARTSFASFNKANRKLFENKQKVLLHKFQTHVKLWYQILPQLKSAKLLLILHI